MKKNSPQKSRRTSGHIPSLEMKADPDPIEADLERLSSLLPDELKKEIVSEPVTKSISIFLSGVARGWGEHHKAFAKYGIGFADIALPVMETGMYFMTLRHFRDRVKTYIEPHQNKLSSYTRAASYLSKPEAPFPSILKEALRQHTTTVLSQPNEIYLQELERYFHLPSGTKNIDPSTEKSLHKQPMFVALLNDLYLHLKKKRVPRPNRLLYDLWISSGIIRSPLDCDFPSFKRQLFRRKGKLQILLPR